VSEYGATGGLCFEVDFVLCPFRNAFCDSGTQDRGLLSLGRVILDFGKAAFVIF
jgi:hypothetical protein